MRATPSQEKLGRDPTDVECFDMGQSNSEHSRHWYFSGKMVIDGVEKTDTLFQMVKATLPRGVPNNSIIAFHDNSSSIRGYAVDALSPTSVTGAGRMVVERKTLHPILTAETHNFPSAVAPFPGAETGTGGRLRDVMATGRGAYAVAGVAAYCVGNLRVPGYDLPWEDGSFDYPGNLASPLDIEVLASDGASDYGNKFGEPVIHGFTRSFGLRLPGGERFEWVKPIMFTAGVGALDGRHTTKGAPEGGMLVVKVGGPCYRIGIGGGAASSRVQSSENASLDFDAVQRGDAEMENRMNRLMRACCDMGDDNPIISVHDQGAGGNGNVLKEIVEPAGAEYDIRKVCHADVGGGMGVFCAVTFAVRCLLMRKMLGVSLCTHFFSLSTIRRFTSATTPYRSSRFGEPNTRRIMPFSYSRRRRPSSEKSPSARTVRFVSWAP